MTMTLVDVSPKVNCAWTRDPLALAVFTEENRPGDLVMMSISEIPGSTSSQECLYR